MDYCSLTYPCQLNKVNKIKEELNSLFLLLEFYLLIGKRLFSRVTSITMTNAISACLVVHDH